MIGMVRGKSATDGSDHRDAMKERHRKEFHHQFTTMRFVPLSEHGQWPEPLLLSGS
jgi:hypothetical protein